MSDSTYIGQKVQNLEVAPEFDTITRVIIHAGQTTDAQGNTKDLDYIAGNTTGRTIEVDDPFGTQAKANALLNRLQNSEFQYQPYQADKALLDPAAELGDAVTISDTYSALYRRDITFSSLMAADLAAPNDEEIEHEFPYIPKEDRVYKRETEFTRSQLKLNENAITAEVANRQTAVNGAITTMRGELNVKANEINATVSAEATRAKNAEGTKLNHTNTAQAFGWSLTSTAFLLKNNNAEVFRFDKDGLRFKSNGSDVFTVTRTGGLYVKGNGEFTGKITASSGTIGGITIASNAIYTNGKTGIDTAKDGLHISADGISLGNSKFKVTKAGQLTAKSGYIGNGTSGFTISNSAIYNGKTSFAIAGNGVYIGTNGIALGDGTNQHSFRVSKTGEISLQYGMTSRDDTTNNGMFIGKEGIALGAGKFKVTNAGAVTAKSGSIGGFTIDASKISSLNSDKGVEIRNASSGCVFQVGKNFKIGADGYVNVNNNFIVDTNGNATIKGNATIGGNATIRGTLYASDIKYGNVGGVNYGTFSGNGITNNSISGGKIGTGTITGGQYGNIASGTVAYGNVGFTGTLDQVGTNAANIDSLSGRVANVEAGYFNSISTNNIAFGDYYFYVSGGYVRAAPIY